MHSLQPGYLVKLFFLILACCICLGGKSHAGGGSFGLDHYADVGKYDFFTRSENNVFDLAKKDVREAPRAEEIPQNAVKNAIGMVFVPVRAGQFQMGSLEDEPGHEPDEIRHQVSLSRNFYMQMHEVTNRQYVKFLNAVDHRGPMGQPWFQTRAENSESSIYEQDGTYHVVSGFEQYPVIDVSWYGAVAFADWLSEKTDNRYALPTEAQWEYACRASTTSAYFWGEQADCSQMMYENAAMDDDDEENDRCVAYIKNKGLKPDFPAPVGTYPPNPWQIHDMHGNVWEWCHDRYGEYSRIAVADPTGPAFGNSRVLRGGSWQNKADACRSANRHSAEPATRNSWIGFRVIRYPYN